MQYWCDMDCPDAAFPKEEGIDGSGSCRTFLAVYCKKHKRINMKNSACIDVKLKQKSSKQKKEDDLPRKA